MNGSTLIICLPLALLVFVMSGCTPGPAQQVAPVEAPETGPIPNPTNTADQKTEFHLVVIGDSSLWGVADALAPMVEKETGLLVVVHDFALSVLSAGEVLEVLETGKSARFQLSKLPDEMKRADMVVMWTNPEDSDDPQHPNGIGSCFYNEAPKEPCGPEVYGVFVQHLRSIWGKIAELKAGEPVILRATDFYNPLIAKWKEKGVEDECTACWEHLSDAARTAAEQANVPFISRMEAYNGPAHQEDPIEKGYISDGQHPSELGAKVQAEWILKAGWEPTIVSK